MRRRTLLLMPFLLLLLGQATWAVTLISRSAGLELPIKEEGKTEYEVGDVDGDGNLDLVSVGDHGSPYINSDQHGIMVWLGDGAGTWTVHQFGDFGYGGCALGDLNLDGRLDIAWGVHHNYGAGMGSRLMGAALGDGSGAFWTDWGDGLASNGETWGMFSTALADFDANGRLDIACQSFGSGNGVRVYENRGDGSWGQVWAQTGGNAGFRIEACDFDADGRLDIACTRYGTNIYRGDGAFGFTLTQAGLPTGTVAAIDVGDADNDGADDILLSIGATGLRCFRYDTGASTWVEASAGFPTTGTYTLVQLGDLNGDGLLDAVGYSGPVGRVFLGDGGSSWTLDATWTMPSPGDNSALRIDGDVDHDGREDIVIQAVQSGFPVNHNQLRVYSPLQEPDALSARITTPKGGETMRVGSIREIRWLAAVPPAQGRARVSLDLSMSGPEGPWIPIALDLPDNGRHAWQVAPLGTSSHCRVRMTIATPADTVRAISSDDFTILQDPASVGSQAGGNAFSIRCLPNPASDGTWIVLQGAPAPTATIELFDPSGRRYHRSEVAAIGGVRIPLPTGVSFVHARSGDAEASVRVVRLP
jgi:hypothetical protein